MAFDIGSWLSLLLLSDHFTGVALWDWSEVRDATFQALARSYKILFTNLTVSTVLFVLKTN